jgi:tetraacyldisaccharide 4'-kinase
MDDGLQNPGIAPSQAMLVVDGGYGFGNGRVIPAGPLRESVAAGLSRVQLALVMGEDKAGIAQRIDGHVPVVHGDIMALSPDLWAGRRVLAFAGIGRPEKFFATLEHLGAVIVARHGFPDHYPYDAGEIDALLVAASVSGATLVTTAKDHVRLPPHQRDQVQILPVGLVWRGSEDEAKVRAWLGALL